MDKHFPFPGRRSLVCGLSTHRRAFEHGSCSGSPLFGALLRSRCLSGAGASAFALVTLAALSCPGAASAQEVVANMAASPSATANDGPATSDIIVTATRRATSIADTPVAITVTSGATLQKYNIASFQDLSTLDPTLVVNNQGLTGNQFIIRGILSDIGSTTGFYVDEAPLVGGAGVQENGDGKPGLRLHDIERVEVLEGPQGTLFGSGSMAGTLRIITNKPKLGETSGGMSASVGGVQGGEATNEEDGYINLPVTSTIAVRAVAWGEFGGGYIDHAITNVAGTQAHTNSNVNGATLWGGRFSVLFKPDDRLSVLLQANHQNAKVDDFQSWILGAGPYTNTLPTVAPYSENYSLYTGTVNYDTDIGTITAIGSYGDQHDFHPEDTTAISQGLAAKFHLLPDKTVLVTQQHFQDYTGEVRFASKLKGPLQFVVGAYYEHDDTKEMTTAVRADDTTGIADCYTIAECAPLGLRQAGFSTPGLVPASNVKNESISDETVSQWAVYAQADYHIFSNLTATAGIRYFHADISNYGVAIQNIAPDWAIGKISIPAVNQNAQTSQHSPSYNFSLLYKVTPDVSIYGRIASGFRIGGTNNTAALASQAGVSIPSTYGSDKLWDYEIGAKAYFDQHRLYIDGTIYQMNWTGQQLSATDPSGAFSYVLNAGKTRIRGGELKANYTLPMGLSFGGGVTYTDAILLTNLGPAVAEAGTVGFAGNRLPRVPHWTFAGQAEYDYRLDDRRSLYLQSNFSYRGSSFYSFNHRNAFDEELPSYFILGLRAGYQTGPFDISLFVDNATDKVALVGMDASTHGVKVFSVPPRTIGGRFQAHF